MNTATTLQAIESSVSNGCFLRLLEHERVHVRSHEQLLEDGDRVAAGLRSHGVEPGGRVGVLATTSFEFVASCLGIWRAGGVLVPLALPAKLGSRDEWRKRTDRIVNRARLGTVLYSKTDPAFAEDVPRLPIEEIRGSWNEASSADRDDVALVQFTSGSTTAPRGVVISHRALMGHFGAQEKLTPLEPESHHLLNWLPLYHDLGLIAVLFRSLVRGISTTLLPTAHFLERPARWIEEMSRWEATHSWAPNFAFALAARTLERWEGEPLDLSSWRRAGCGGEPVDASTLQRFAAVAERFSFDPRALSPGYGLAEATCVVTGLPYGSGIRVDRVDRRSLADGYARPSDPDRTNAAAFVSVGPPLPGVHMKIAAPDGSPLPERAVGQIWVRGPTIMDRYDDDLSATEAVLEDGWLKTGDLGYLASTELFVTGRLKDLVILGGQNFYPVDIERTVEQTPGVRPGSCVAFSVSAGSSEALVVASETKLDAEALDACRDDIRRRVWGALGLALHDVVLVAPGTIPKTTSGKLQRGLVRDRYQSGQLTGVGDERTPI